MRGPSQGVSCLKELLDREAALDRRVVATGGSGDDLELELIAEGGDVRWNLELCHRGRKVDAELDALPLDEELVSSDLDGSHSPTSDATWVTGSRR